MSPVCNGGRRWSCLSVANNSTVNVTMFPSENSYNLQMFLTKHTKRAQTRKLACFSRFQWLRRSPHRIRSSSLVGDLLLSGQAAVISGGAGVMWECAGQRTSQRWILPTGGKSSRWSRVFFFYVMEWNTRYVKNLAPHRHYWCIKLAFFSNSRLIFDTLVPPRFNNSDFQKIASAFLILRPATRGSVLSDRRSQLAASATQIPVIYVNKWRYWRTLGNQWHWLAPHTKTCRGCRSPAWWIQWLM